MWLDINEKITSVYNHQLSQNFYNLHIVYNFYCLHILNIHDHVILNTL